jgi:6-pyruvoyl-tetrahydropterin synthase
MMLDFSYMQDQPSEAQEQAIQEAITRECIKAIAIYLEEVAMTMETQAIESLNVPTLRAMAKELTNRNTNNEEN